MHIFNKIKKLAKYFKQKFMPKNVLFLLKKIVKIAKRWGSAPRPPCLQRLEDLPPDLYINHPTL